MMRMPTPASQLYAWHRAALAGDNPPIHEGQPHCGWFRLRRVKGGPWVPVRIWCEREIDPETGELTCDERLRAEVEGIERDPVSIWTYLHPIPRAEFERITDQLLRIPGLTDTGNRFDLSAAAMRP